MPRYYFDITDGDVLVRDEFGADCADGPDARDQAVAILFDIAAEKLPDSDRHGFAAAVRDEAGQVVYEARLSLDGRWWPGRR